MCSTDGKSASRNKSRHFDYFPSGTLEGSGRRGKSCKIMKKTKQNTKKYFCILFIDDLSTISAPLGRAERDPKTCLLDSNSPQADRKQTPIPLKILGFWSKFIEKIWKILKILFFSMFSWFSMIFVAAWPLQGSGWKMPTNVWIAIPVEETVILSPPSEGVRRNA